VRERTQHEGQGQAHRDDVDQVGVMVHRTARFLGVIGRVSPMRTPRRKPAMRATRAASRAFPRPERRRPAWGGAFR
jgi:hypothetical protein